MFAQTGLRTRHLFAASCGNAHYHSRIALRPLLKPESTCLDCTRTTERGFCEHVIHILKAAKRHSINAVEMTTKLNALKRNFCQKRLNNISTDPDRRRIFAAFESRACQSETNNRSAMRFFSTCVSSRSANGTNHHGESTQHLTKRLHN